jgi:hypothetical protein
MDCDDDGDDDDDDDCLFCHPSDWTSHWALTVYDGYKYDVWVCH